MSSEVLIIAAFIVVVLLVVGVAWRITVRRAAARLEALRRQALMLGYSLREETVKLASDDITTIDDLIGAPVNSFQLLEKGRSSRMSGLLIKSGDHGRSDWVFDFFYATGSGNSRHTVSQTVIGRTLGGRELPGFVVQPEGLFSRLFDGDDIDFEQDPEFSKRFLLKGERVQEVKRLFAPYVRSALVEKKDWAVEASGGCVLALRKGRLIKPEDLPTALAEFNQFLDTLCAGD